MKAQYGRHNSLKIELLKGEVSLYNARGLDSSPEDVLLRRDVVRLTDAVQGVEVVRRAVVQLVLSTPPTVGGGRGGREGGREVYVERIVMLYRDAVF